MDRARRGVGDDRAGLARSTEFATSILMERFGIAESTLPCLVFVDQDSLDSPLIVPLSPANPIESLYTDILTPISDAFGKLEAFWEDELRVTSFRGRRNQALKRLQSYDQDRADREKKLDDAKAQLEAVIRNDPDGARIVELKSEQLRLAEFGEALRRCETPEDRIALIAGRGGDVADARLALERLRSLEASKKAVNWQSLDKAGKGEHAQLSTLINRTRAEVSDLIGRHDHDVRERLGRLAQELRGERASPYGAAKRAVALAAQEVQSLESQKSIAERTLRWETESKLAELEAELEVDRQALQSEGYDQSTLQAHRGGTLSALRCLAASQRLKVMNRSVRPAGQKLKILFLAANPLDTSSLDLEEELRAIKMEIRGAKYREQIEFIPEVAVRPDDLVRPLRTLTPDIVHFSGHGEEGGIVLLDDGGAARLVSQGALARLLRRRDVKLLVLNACFSDAQASALPSAVKTIVGTTDAVDDVAALRFSVAFYRTLADGHSISDAFRDGGDAVDLNDLENVYRLVGEGDVILVG